MEQTAEQVPEPSTDVPPAAASIDESTRDAANALRADISAVVEAWFSKHFHNMSALYDERAYTHLLLAKEDLKSVFAPLPL